MTRFFTYPEQGCGETDHTRVMVSEVWIREIYYPMWKKLVSRKMTRDAQRMVSQGYPFEECVKDFVDTHWATEVADEQLKFNF